MEFFHVCRLSQIRLNPARVGQTILTSADLEDADFRYLGLREGRAGQVWFTLLNGVGLLDPPNAPPEPSPLRLTPGVDSLTLSPRPNHIDLYAELSDPVASRKARYRFRLIGQTELWSEWTGDPDIPLANVPPDEYRLEIEARGSLWASQPAPCRGGAGARALLGVVVVPDHRVVAVAGWCVEAWRTAQQGAAG